MYAYFTLITIGLIYIIFTVFSIRYGKWYYVFVHPFAFVCAELILKYRYASEIPEIASYADKVLALGIIFASLAFWLSYRLLKVQYLERLCSLFRIDQKNEESGISPQKFWILIAIILITILSYYICQYIRFGKFEYLFFQVYNRSVDEIAQQSSFEMRAINWFVRSFWAITMYVSLVLFFETVRKQKQLHGFVPLLAALMVSLLSMTSLFLTGYRSQALFCCDCLLLLVVMSFLRPSFRLSIIAVPLLVILFSYCCFDVICIRHIRCFGITKIGESIVNVVTQSKTREVAIERAFVVQENIKQPEIRFEKKLISSQNFDNSDNTLSPDRTKENVPRTPVEKIKKNEEIKKMEEVKKIAKEKEYNYLRKMNYGHSMSQQNASLMLYWGRHHPFLGMTYSFRTLINRVMPPPLGKDNSFPSISQILYKEGFLSGLAISPFGEGYASGGLIGGYLYWICVGAFCGLLAKMALFFLFWFRCYYLESIVLGLCLFICVPATMTVGTSLVDKPLKGLLLFFVCEFVIFRFIHFYKTWRLRVRPE